MTDKQNFEKDINVPSKRLDRIDKMEIDLANYEQMELDIEKIIEPYQLNWELDCLSLPSAIQSILERKEQECERLKKIINEAKNSKLDLKSFLVGEAVQNEYEQQLDQLKAENDELKKLLKVRIEDLCDSCGASSMMPMPCKVYEKTLTEIKTDILYIREGISYFWVIDKCDEILQKISEVEE